MQRPECVAHRSRIVLSPALGALDGQKLGHGGRQLFVGLRDEGRQELGQVDATAQVVACLGTRSPTSRRMASGVKGFVMKREAPA